jgi:hypothetical protein
MISRRRVLGSGLLGGVLGLAAGDRAEAAPAAQQISERAVERIAEAIAQLRTELQVQRQFTELTPIRDVQKVFLRANGKFPDYIEVGSDIWFGVHDWHIRWQQPLTLGRDGLGRYTLMLNQTLVILRPDVLANFISQPYDNR